MAARNPKLKNMFQSLGYIYVIVWLAFVVYLDLSDSSKQYIIETLRSPEVVYIPSAVLPYLRDTSNSGLLMLFAIKCAHHIVYGYLVYGLFVYFGGLVLSRYRPIETLERKHNNESIDNKTQMKIVRPIRQGQGAPIIIDCSYDAQFYNLGRANVPLKRSPENAIDTLQQSILQVLEFHKDWPGCIDGHHSNETLKNHSIAVARRLVEISSDRGECDSVAVLVGLAHDFDKLVAYERKGDTWVRKATNYRHIGKDLLFDLDGFESLSDVDRRAVSYAIKYSHSPESMPKDATPREVNLLLDLRRADNLATKQEQEVTSSADTLVDTGNNPEVELIADVLWKVIDVLDVNKHRGGMANEGWYSKGESYWGVTNTTLLDLLEEHLPQDLRRKYQIGINNKRAKHPATPLITAALKSMDLALTKVGPVDSEDCLYLVKAGRFKFMNVRVLSAERISQFDRNLLKRWGSTEHPLKIMEPKSA